VLTFRNWIDAATARRRNPSLRNRTVTGRKLCYSDKALSYASSELYFILSVTPILESGGWPPSPTRSRLGGQKMSGAGRQESAGCIWLGIGRCQGHRPGPSAGIRMSHDKSLNYSRMRLFIDLTWEATRYTIKAGLFGPVLGLSLYGPLT
jgi:hypothetical protein